MTAAIAPETGVVLHDLGELLTQLAPRLLRLATRYTRDPDAGADVVQNAVEKVVRTRRSSADTRSYRRGSTASSSTRR